jgi:hypothetical protein
MIIVRLNGGLGNQMFQYALGRKLAIIHNTILKLDTKWFVKGIRQYELVYLNIQEEIATAEEVISMTRMTNSFSNRITRNLIEPVLPYYKRSQVEEKYNSFDSNIFKSPDNIYLKGYWQTEKYFIDIEKQIRREFIFKKKLDSTNQQLENTIKKSNAVSVHIRRGDYVSNPEYLEKYGPCSITYYEKAYKFIENQVSKALYFIFSDDPEWAKSNISFFKPCIFVEHNSGENSYKDMQLMSMCRHNIIANSSFSWWGAWLNTYPNKVVIAPENWFKDSTAENKDIIPISWFKI